MSREEKQGILTYTAYQTVLPDSVNSAMALDLNASLVLCGEWTVNMSC
jgi:hypothetical protein